MLDQKDAQSLIEKQVLGKKITQATLSIPKYYRKFGHKSEVLFQCCDWYRRLGHYQKGIALLKINSGNLKITLSTTSKEGRKILWFARLSNLLGASSIAKRLIANITPASSEDHRIFGLIHLTNFSFQKAFDSFTEVVSRKLDTKTYQNRMNLLNLADAGVGLKNISEAIEIQEKLLAAAESEFEIALYRQALGESYSHLEEWDKALEYLNAAELFYANTPSNIDLAFLQKWQALCYSKKSEIQECHSYIERSISSLVKLSAKEDALILALDVAASIKYLNKEQNQKLALIKKIFYNHKTDFTWADQIGTNKALLKINWKSQEVRVQHKKKNSFHFELNKETYLIVLLKLFEDWGINYYRIYDLLYSDDPFGIVSARDRIKSLVQRLNKVYGLKVTTKGQRLFIAKSSAKKILIQNLDETPRFSFLENAVVKSNFQIKDVSAFYLISRTQANHLIQRWLNENLILRQGDSYRIVVYKS